MAHPYPTLRLSLPKPPPMGWRGRSILSFSLLASAYLLGFAVYVTCLPTPFTTLPAHLQGLATFTGGSGRVEAALHEAQEGFPGPILISGRHGTTTLADMLARTETTLTPTQQARIVYDTAASTRQNILGLSQWAAHYHIRHIGLITSTYHIARVRLLAFLHARNLKITYLPVQPADPGLMPLFKEYNKLLAAPFLR